MAKASSPVRIQETLMNAATLEAYKSHRSTAEQIEYWAELGRSIAHVINPDVLMSLRAGVSTLKVVDVPPKPIDPDEVFASIERKRKEGVLSASVTKSDIRYQASTDYPGYLEQIKGTTVTIGQFDNGQFIPMDRNV
ncbi:hypothetical protein ACFOEK_12125 [Litoribrevibacter euphylliae]|uniref:ParD-like antitoxin of type II toxin-antitoxin system n=1 Tax=Litoribrevibacter euphylliae TaxID=1834034 RepID=A0ABV7HJD5_9GAMM